MNTQNSTVNILFLGDIVGRSGRKVVKSALMSLKEEYNVDFVIANAENSANGTGITLKVYKELIGSGIDCLTSGNHIWDKKEALENISEFEKLIIPGNFPEKSPGNRFLEFDIKGLKLIVTNFMGRVFMPLSDCPFKKLEQMLEDFKDSAVIADFHAEATSEKVAFGNYFDGRIAAFIGTHTHVQTNDDRILPKGTYFISDAGMNGALDSCIGVKKEAAIRKYLTGIPERFEVETSGGLLFNGIFLKIDTYTKRVNFYEKVKKTYEE